jgi:predicted DCC family thiol-disulfide oxidoreductase YuxK
MNAQALNAHGILASLGPEPLVVYDGDCPFCSRYVAWTRLRDSAGPVTLRDARTLDPQTLSALRRDYDLDKGMLFVNGGAVYWGPDAIHAMALLTTGSSLFNRINAAIFRSRALSRLLYPLLRLGRGIALWLLGRRPIHP